MKSLPKRQACLKGLCVQETDCVYVGIDVHRRSYHVAVWIHTRIEKTLVMPANDKKIVDLLRPLGPQLRQVAYEAGPTGYGLARELQAAGIDGLVAAPSRTPRSGPGQAKSDRLDCRKLAEYAAKRLLTGVCIPTPQQEADRQLVRLRDPLANKRRRVKQQIKSFLLMHGINQPVGLAYWTQASVAALRRIALGASLRYGLGALLDELAFVEDRIRQTEQALRAVFAEERHRGAMAILTSPPGVGPVTAWHFLTEVHDPRRFKKATHLAKYVGLCPKVSQSGESRCDGPIVKTGRRALRSLLVEVAWQWKARDPRAALIYRRLVSNTGCGQKAIVGLARHLAINLWRMCGNHELYRAAA